jgi:hypothetical protein
MFVERKDLLLVGGEFFCVALGRREVLACDVQMWFGGREAYL